MSPRWWLLLAISLPLASCPSPSEHYRRSASVQMWVRTDEVPPMLSALLSDKSSGGAVVDLTDDRDLGLGRRRGDRRGWALSTYADGWSWNLGDGWDRLDYRADSDDQPLADGRWHMLAFTLDAEQEVAHLYHDGRRVASYCLADMGNWLDGRSPLPGMAELGEGLDVRDVVESSSVWTAEDVERRWLEGGGWQPTSLRSPARDRPLRVMTWNILHGGREDGADGLRRTVEVIRESGADVVCLQEAYGAGPVVAGALGFHMYQRSAGLVIVSRYPILETHAVSTANRCGGITVEPWPGQRVHVMDVWLGHLPDIEDAVEEEGVTAAELVRGELATRSPQIADILADLQPLLHGPDPVILAGDFNCPSHRDFVESTADRHHGLVVPWPVSRAVEEQGFRDALREVHPDPAAHPGHTWSPRWEGVFPHRIDFVFHHGDELRVEAVRTRDQHPEQWPSDHAAVLARFAAPGTEARAEPRLTAQR